MRILIKEVVTSLHYKLNFYKKKKRSSIFIYKKKNPQFFFKIYKKNQNITLKLKKKMYVYSNYQQFCTPPICLKQLPTFLIQETLRPILLLTYLLTRNKSVLVSNLQSLPLFIGNMFNSLNTTFSTFIFFYDFYFFVPPVYIKKKDIKQFKTQLLANTYDLCTPDLISKGVIFFALNYKIKNKHLQCDINYSLLNNYLKKILFDYTGFDTDWFFFNIEPSTMLTKYLVIINKLYKSRQQRFLKIKKHFYFRLIVQLSLLKSPRLLILALEHLFIKTPIKRHRSIFFRLRHLLKVWYFIARKKRCLKGFSFFFKGKLGKKGSVRKRKFFTKKGLISFTNKDLRVNYSNYILWTNTGCIGANISIFF